MYGSRLIVPRARAESAPVSTFGPITAFFNQERGLPHLQCRCRDRKRSRSFGGGRDLDERARDRAMRWTVTVSGGELGAALTLHCQSSSPRPGSSPPSAHRLAVTAGLFPAVLTEFASARRFDEPERASLEGELGPWSSMRGARCYQPRCSSVRSAESSPRFPVNATTSGSK